MSSKLKKLFESRVKPIVPLLNKMGITPNHLTIMGLLVALFSGWTYANWNNEKTNLLISAGLILLSGFLDAIDGVLARTTGKASKFGGFFDSVADRYSDILIISGVIIGGLCDVSIGIIALSGSLMVSYTRSRAEMEGVNMAGIGFFERAERMIFISLNSIAAFWWLQILNYGMIILALLTHFTLLQRVLFFKKEVEKV